MTDLVKPFKLAFSLFLLAVGFIYVTKIVNYTVIDNLNLIFHEAGHLILLPFGQFIHILGGSLFQLGIPLVVAVYFYLQGDYYASGFGAFWFGESLINLSYYIGDATRQVLPLLGGDGSIHDWHYLLAQAHLLKYDQFLGGTVFILGGLIMLGASAFMFYYVIRYNDD